MGMLDYYESKYSKTPSQNAANQVATGNGGMLNYYNSIDEEKKKKIRQQIITTPKTAPAQSAKGPSFLDNIVNTIKTAVIKALPQLTQKKPSLDYAVATTKEIKTPTKPLVSLEGTTKGGQAASATLTPQAQGTQQMKAIGGFTKNIVDSVLKFTSNPVDSLANTALNAIPGVQPAINAGYKKGTKPLDVIKGLNDYVTKKIEKVNPGLAGLYTAGTFLVPGKFEYFIAKELENAPKELDTIWKDNRKTILERAGQSAGQVVVPLITYFFAPKAIEKFIPKTTQKQLFEILGISGVNALKIGTYKKLIPLVNVLARGSARGASTLTLINAAQVMKQGLKQGAKVEDILKKIIETSPEAAGGGALFGLAAEGWGVAQPKLFGYRQSGVAEMTPDEARAQVEGTDLKGTPAGDKIMQEALKAEANGGHVRIEVIGTTKGTVEKTFGKETAKTVAGAVGTSIPEPIPASPEVVKTEGVRTPGNVDIRVTTVEGPTEAQKLTSGSEVKQPVEEGKIINKEPIKVEDMTLYRGTREGNKPITNEVTKSWEKVLVVNVNQSEIIKELADQGNPKAVELAKTIPKNGRIDFSKADPIIKDAYKDEYNAIQYNNDTPQLKAQGTTYFDLSSGQSFAVKKETANIYAINTRAAKYEVKSTDLGPNANGYTKEEATKKIEELKKENPENNFNIEKSHVNKQGVEKFVIKEMTPLPTHNRATTPPLSPIGKPPTSQAQKPGQGGDRGGVKNQIVSGSDVADEIMQMGTDDGNGNIEEVKPRSTLIKSVKKYDYNLKEMNILDVINGQKNFDKKHFDEGAFIRNREYEEPKNLYNPIVLSIDKNIEDGVGRLNKLYQDGKKTIKVYEPIDKKTEKIDPKKIKSLNDTIIKMTFEDDNGEIQDLSNLEIRRYEKNLESLGLEEVDQTDSEGPVLAFIDPDKVTKEYAVSVFDALGKQRGTPGIKTDKDSNMLLYHGTDKEGYDNILKVGFEGGYYSMTPEKDAGGSDGALSYGPYVVESTVDPRYGRYNGLSEFIFGDDDVEKAILSTRGYMEEGKRIEEKPIEKNVSPNIPTEDNEQEALQYLKKEFPEKIVLYHQTSVAAKEKIMSGGFIGNDNGDVYFSVGSYDKQRNTSGGNKAVISIQLKPEDYNMLLPDEGSYDGATTDEIRANWINGGVMGSDVTLPDDIASKYIKPIENKPTEKGQPIKEELVMKPSKASTESEIMTEAAKFNLPPDVLKRIKGTVVGFNRPNIARADLKVFVKNSEDFKKNPYLIVDKQKYLTFTSPNFRFKIAPERMQLSREALQEGDKIKVDIGSLNDKEQQMRVYQSGNTYADAGGYADVESAEKTVEKIKAIEFPELLRIAKELMGSTPTLKAYRRALGMFYADPTNPNIKLNPLIFKDPTLAAKVFAHEIGHLTDFIPDKSMKRGNLLGRIASLQSYHKSFLEASPDAEEGLLTEEDRKRLRKEAKELASKPVKVESEVIVGETTAKPEEILAIWNDTNAGTLYPELQKYIQTLSSAQKIEIVKHALKGTVPEWIGFKEYIKKTVVTEIIKNAPADIKAIYDRLIKEEVERRNLFFIKEVRSELKKMTQVWKPFVEELVPPAYRKYRYSGPELYADAISVLFNDPDLLKNTAPEFYRGFFNYLDNKSEAKNIFNDIWTTLNKGEDAVFQKRDEAMSEAFATAEEKYTAKHVEKQIRKGSLVEQIRILIDNKNQAVINKTREALKMGANIPASENPIYSLASLNYMQGKVKNYIEDNFQPVYQKANEVPDGWNLLGKVLQLERTMFERGDLANPGGYDPLTAKAQLEGLERNTPPDEWKKIQEAKESFRAAVQDSISEAEKAGYYSPEMIELMKANPAYATYQVIDYLDTFVSAAIKQQVGTLKDVANPATSTVMKTISLIRAIERNNVKKDVVKMLQKGFPGDISPSRTRFNGKAMEVLDTREKDKETVKVIVNGKTVGYDMDKSIADSLTFMSNDAVRSAAKIARMFSLSPIYRPLFTSLNLGFQTFNFVRDFERYWKNVPDYTFGQAITSFPRAVLRYGQALPSATRRAFGKSDPLLREMEKAKILGIKLNDVFKEPIDSEDSEIQRVMQSIGILNKETKRNRLLLPAIKLMEGVELLGNLIESLPKIAGYKELKGKMEPEELANFIRTKVGSPDFLTGGTLTPITNSIFLFSNAAKEGIKSDAQVASGRSEGGRRSQAGFWWKTIVATILPKVIMAAIAAGIMGKALKDQMDGVSEYDKSQYHIIPVGLDENGKTKYLRVPQDETSRTMGAIIWKAMNMVAKRKGGIEDIMQILNIGAGQLPNLAPSFTSLGVIMQYIAGQNPYDSFRGRNVISDQAFQAGPKYSLPELLDWLAQTNGLGMVIPSYQPENPTSLQKFLNLPGVSNTAGRWFKVSDYGKTEQNREITGEIKTQKAAESLENKKILQKYVDQYNSGPKNVSSKMKIERELVKEVVGNPPYTTAEKTQKTNLIKKFRVSALRGEVDADVNSLITAASNDERIALLLDMSKTRSDSDINSLLRDLKKQGIVSSIMISLYKSAKRRQK